MTKIDTIIPISTEELESGKIVLSRHKIFDTLFLIVIFCIGCIAFGGFFYREALVSVWGVGGFSASIVFFLATSLSMVFYFWIGDESTHILFTQTDMILIERDRRFLRISLNDITGIEANTKGFFASYFGYGEIIISTHNEGPRIRMGRIASIQEQAKNIDTHIRSHENERKESPELVLHNL